MIEASLLGSFLFFPLGSINKFHVPFDFKFSNETIFYFRDRCIGIDRWS